MSYCEKCGAQLDDATRFCPVCGAENTSIAAQVVDPNLPPQGLNVMAIVGMGLSGFGIPGIIVSAIAKKRANSGQYRHPLGPLATAGIVVSILMTIFWIAYFIFIVVLASKGISEFNY
jgi:hypothetical protein